MIYNLTSSSSSSNNAFTTLDNIFFSRSMAEVLNSEGLQGIESSNSSENGSPPFCEAKKKKYVYSPDYIREIGRSSSDQLQQPSQQHSELTNIIYKLRDLIMSSNDDSVIQSMKNILTESQSGRIFLVDVALGETNLSSLSNSFDRWPTTASSYFQVSSPIVSTISGQLPPIRSSSPRKIDTVLTPIPVVPLSQQLPQQQQQQAAFRSPRKQLSQSSLNLSYASASTTPTTTTPTIGTPTISPNTSSSSIDTQTTSNNGMIKKSPSMSTIPKSNISEFISNDSLKEFGNKSKSNAKAWSSNVSANNIFGFGNSVSSGGTSSLGGGVEEQSLRKSSSNYDLSAPRKSMTKSFSMTSISASDSSALSLKEVPLDGLAGQVYSLTKYQAGCRFLQKKLEENPTPEYVSFIFNEIYDHLSEVMVDPYGQYLIPQLMKHCDDDQKRLIIECIALDVERYACHRYGIHGVQKVIQSTPLNLIKVVTESMRYKVVVLSNNANGNYLIQSFLKQFTPEINQFICDGVIENMVAISTNKYGCTVVNRCLEHANQQQQDTLIDSILGHSLHLVQDPFGNYVVQHLLSNNKSYSSQLLKRLNGHIVGLSVQKFSSNVIEKWLLQSDPSVVEQVISELERDLPNVLQDKYANYVIKTCLDVASPDQFARLASAIVPHIHNIKTPYILGIQKKILGTIA
ncbi:hypothetical protein SAMD00019534_122390, partial [Acytostelium subglobosum LB1]|uniref:hypothetical protein n=1 Tax=Acytostelium subglobosum LB1 TaxID=1410327 RepID=UPI0006448BBC